MGLSRRGITSDYGHKIVKAPPFYTKYQPKSSTQVKKFSNSWIDRPSMMFMLLMSKELISFHLAKTLCKQGATMGRDSL